MLGIWGLGFPEATLAVMHLLHSAAMGTEVIDERDHQIQGKVAESVLDPDRGKSVAFLIRSPFSPSPLLLQTLDVLTWGQRIHIREPEVMGPPEDIVRLAPFLQDRRPLIGQRILTKSGAILGRCSDAQFNTEHFALEWIFPRTAFFFKGTPIPASDILEVTEEAIIVKDQTPKEEKAPTEEIPVAPKLDPVITPAAGRTAKP